MAFSGALGSGSAACAARTRADSQVCPYRCRDVTIENRVRSMCVYASQRHGEKGDRRSHPTAAWMTITPPSALCGIVCHDIGIEFGVRNSGYTILNSWSGRVSEPESGVSLLLAHLSTCESAGVFQDDRHGRRPLPKPRTGPLRDTLGHPCHGTRNIL